MRLIFTSLTGLAVSLTLTGCNTGSASANQSRIERGHAILAQCITTECERLDLDAAELQDYSVLKDLTHVRALMVSYTNFSELSDIQGNSQYTELHIGASNVTDLSALPNFPNLKLLHAQDLDVVDNDPIRELKQLEELIIGRSDFSDLSLCVGSCREVGGNLKAA